MSRKKPELLAPAGNMEKLKMALQYGADAVYLGGQAFGLRAFGGNFTPEELREAVAFTHAMGKKVYVTQVRGIAEARIWDNFEEWFREKLQESAPKSPSPEAESMAYLEKHPDTVIICDEVGSGIVPLDSFEREYRERLGRLLCEIAAKAERVERIVCGIGQRIK